MFPVLIIVMLIFCLDFRSLNLRPFVQTQTHIIHLFLHQFGISLRENESLSASIFSLFPIIYVFIWYSIIHKILHVPQFQPLSTMGASLVFICGCTDSSFWLYHQGLLLTRSPIAFVWVTRFVLLICTICTILSVVFITYKVIPYVYLSQFNTFS